MAGIVYRLRTGCQWKALPRDFGSGSTCHARFQQWCTAGVFTEIFSKLIQFYDRKCGIQWKWSSLDSAMAKAPKGGTSRVRTPRIARRVASNATILTDGHGVPLAAEITGANVHDKWLVGQTLDAVVLRAPRGPRRPENLCLDKGYDYEDAEAAVRVRGITPHIRRRGENPLLGCV
jgi:putative transposase